VIPAASTILVGRDRHLSPTAGPDARNAGEVSGAGTGRIAYVSLSGGRISTSMGSLPGPVASVVFGATWAGKPGDLRVRRLLLPPLVLRAAFRAGAALRVAAAFRAGPLRAAFLAVFFAVFFAAFFAVFLPPAFLVAPLRAFLPPELLRAVAFLAPPALRADLPLDFRAFATFRLHSAALVSLWPRRALRRREAGGLHARACAIRCAAHCRTGSRPPRTRITCV
jgi:hypothetical protein